MSVFVVVPHPEQVPRSRVSSETTGCARLSVITVASKLSVVRALGCYQHLRGHLFF